jgi:hypothetical protein
VWLVAMPVFLVGACGCDGEDVVDPGRAASGSTVERPGIVSRDTVPRPLMAVPREDGSGDFEMLEMSSGDLRVAAWDNTYSPGRLSGLRSLLNLRDAPDYDAFRVALNFEHVISGHNRPANDFSPRHGPYRLKQITETSVEWVRRAEDSPWKLDSTMRARLSAPNAIDFRFSCTPRDAGLFGEHGYAVLFWANYMNPLTEIDMHFRGVTGPDEEEKWVSVQAPRTDFLHRHGGVYRSRDAKRLSFDDDHKSPWNVASYQFPRFTRPFYYARADHDMVLIMMFDRMATAVDEIRFAMYRFQVKEETRRPAWDFQYVIRKVEAGRRYGFSGRLVYKKFAGAADCESEYERWRAGRDQSSTDLPSANLRTRGAR